MNNLSIDIETYSEIDLNKCGVYKYAESTSFEILLFSYSVDGGEVACVDIASGEKLPSCVIDALQDNNVCKWAYNANFERVCLSRFLSMPAGTYLDPTSWKCSMVWASTLGLPLALVGAGAVLGLSKQKIEEGKDLIKYFCKPCMPTKKNGGRTRNLPWHDRAKWEHFKEYNIRDVEVELAIKDKLKNYPVPADVWQQYITDQRINDRGVKLDVQFVQSAISVDRNVTATLTNRMKKITSLENPNSVSQLKMWLASKGISVDSLSKKDVSELIDVSPDDVKPALVMRQLTSRSSVSKYRKMASSVCSDSRARGMFQFYGANRTGRWAGRLIQLQNLPQNHLADLDTPRELVCAGNVSALTLLFDDVPDVLSQLVRTAFVPRASKKFIVADFSAIEARVIAWLAGEKWRLEMFNAGGDIYCQSASKMFSVPVEKNGTNGHLRQKGKIAELACIAEGELVLTDKGLVPIEKVTTNMKLWDGENWVSHEGVVYKGIKEVITYEGLTATSDHLVWVKGQKKPIHFGVAASRGWKLAKTGLGRSPVRLGKSDISRNKKRCNTQTSICAYSMYRMFIYTVAKFRQFTIRKVKRMSELFLPKASASVVSKQDAGCKTKMRKSKRSRFQKLWWTRYPFRVFRSNRGGCIYDGKIWNPKQGFRNRQNRHKRKLCSRESSLCITSNQLRQPEKKCVVGVLTKILALCKTCCHKEINRGSYERWRNTGCKKSSYRKTEKLEVNRRKARLYDIRNAGKHHRFTVSGHLVHNCGYGGSVGALKAMSALEMGLKEEELKPLVDTWRESNPNITDFWWSVDSCAKTAVKNKSVEETHAIKFQCKSGMLFITLPSGRKLAYVKPKIGTNKFGGECITYEGTLTGRKWGRLETYGPKLVENIVQGTARDLLAHAMQNLKGYDIVMHIHDEVVVEADLDVPVREICAPMETAPSWAEDLQLKADGYECKFYQKQ